MRRQSEILTCKRGHPYTPENTQTYRRWGPLASGELREYVGRDCLTCRRERWTTPERLAKKHREYHAANPEKINARRKVRAEIAQGRLQRQPCEECGAIRVHAHHPNGYLGAAALDVRWLCSKHHVAAHREARHAA